MTTKTTAGIVGLVAYPAQGAVKSVRSAVKQGAKRRIEEAKFAEGKWLVETEAGRSVDLSISQMKYEQEQSKFLSLSLVR
jgi:hypothetical protein